MAAAMQQKFKAPGLLFLLCLLVSCGQQEPVFHAADNPQRLSDWKLFAITDNTLVPNPATLVFEPANTLFTDYAGKLRTMSVPDGAEIMLKDGEFDYPVGTILSKTFYYPPTTPFHAPEQLSLDHYRLIETRLLVRRESGWEAFPYVWNEEESEAFLRVAGTSTTVALEREGQPSQFTYFVPNENQCAGCHKTEHPDGEMHPLGAIASQLHVKRYDASGGYPLQTDSLIARGWLREFPMSLEAIRWDGDADLDSRARAYLDIHCGHCHNPDGAADTSSLILDGSHRNRVQMGVCKPPVAAGGGAADRLYSIVPGEPDRSILLYRMESTRPDEMMPELGRSLVHSEGVALIRQWISAMPGTCP